MNNIESTDVLLTVDNHTSPTHVTTTGDYNNVTGVELDEISDLVLLNVKLDRVIGLDGRVRIANRSSVVRYDVRNALGTYGHFSDFEELVARFLGRDAVNGEAPLNIIKKSEMFA